MRARLGAGPIIAALLSSCASVESDPQRVPAPYKAVVVFETTAPAATQGVPGLDFARLEAELAAGLDEHAVFTEFTVATPETAHEVAERQDADVIVRLGVDSVAEWDPDEKRLVPTAVAVDALLWVTTLIGDWWVRDVEFSTSSDIELRCTVPAATPGAEPRGLSTRLSSGKYRLSLRDRTSNPLSYVLSVVMPAALVPVTDAEVSEALTHAALEDIEEQMASQLREANLSGAPFQFTLEEPTNGSEVRGDPIEIRYRYECSPGAAEHSCTGLHALEIDLKRSGGQYERLRSYRRRDLRELNSAIARGESLTLSLQGLAPGAHYLRFSARTEIGGEWIRNTVVFTKS